jgi:hypothetical protein
LFQTIKGLTVLSAALLIMSMAACGREPTAAPAPTTTLITISPEGAPGEFLEALPDFEHACLEQAVGAENLEELIASTGPNNETMRACLSEETVRAVTLGQIAREAGGLSDETVKCLFDEAASVDFKGLMFGDKVGPEFGILMRALGLCLSDQELVQSHSFGSEEPALNAQQLRCLFTSDPEFLATLGEPGPEVVELLSKCGIPPGLMGEPAAAPTLSPEEEACLIDAVGEEAMQELFSGQRPPTPEEIEAFAGCGPGESDSPPGSGRTASDFVALLA